MKIAPQTSRQLSPEIEFSIKHGLNEDIGPGDATTNPIVSEGAQTDGHIVAKQSGVISGLEVTEAVFHALDQNLEFTPQVNDGDRVERGTVIANLRGSARVMFTAERTALNFLGRMSGIATLTAQFVEAVAGTNAKILDTRKTAPGLRAVDKLAVKHGGGYNHRHGLHDMVLIKDNHVDFAGGIEPAVRLVRDSGTQLEIEVEVRNLADLRIAIELGVQRILLDNMTVEMMKEAVEINDGRAKLEASGNVNLATVRRIAETGVDYISVGELTHSAKVFDVSLKLRTQS